MIFCTDQGQIESVNAIANKDNIDNDIFVFDDITDVTLPNDPVKLVVTIFVLCTSGWGKISINLNEYLIEPGNMLTILPDHIVKGYTISEDFHGLFIGVTPHAVEDLVPDIHTVLPFIMNFRTSPLIVLDRPSIDKLTNFHKFLWEQIRNANGFYSKQVIKHLLQAALYETLNIYRGQKTIKNIHNSRNEEIFFNFFTLVEHSFKVNRSVSFYADKLCISSKHLSAVVKAVSGKTAGVWIDDYVILAAKVLLRSSDRTIQEISLELNFANQSFFGKFFKHRTGMSPSEYRSSLHNTQVPEELL